MLTLGFSCGKATPITLDQNFTELGTDNTFVSTYIQVTSTEGVIVFENTQGNPEVCWAFVGYNPIAATKILTNATIDEVTYTTNANILYAVGSGKAS